MCGYFPSADYRAETFSHVKIYEYILMFTGNACGCMCIKAHCRLYHSFHSLTSFFSWRRRATKPDYNSARDGVIAPVGVDTL